MNNKRFTLAEIVVVITVLAILLAIVLVQFGDLKKRSVHSAMSSNVRILQSSVDTYHLKYDKYPTKNESTLSRGQLIDIVELVEKGLLKKELDTSKIKTQYYWVDVFGRVWGDTVLPPTKVNVIEKSDKRIFEFTLDQNVSKYHIYEVSGYKEGENVSYNQLDIQKPRENAALADGKKYYRLVKSKEVSMSEPTNFTFEGENKNSVYLISIEDDYGLESIPVGLAENNFFTPLINYEGTREYEIESSKLMHWVDFFAFEKKPAGSSITYKFKVKNETGIYGEFTDDFYSLPPSKGIIVEVTMKGNSKKEKPSLYDLRILYNYGGGKTGILPNPPLVFPKGETDPIPPNDTTISKGGGGSGSGSGSDGTGGGEGSGSGTGVGGADGEGSGAGTGTGGTGGTGSGTGGGSTSGSNPEDVCPVGYGVTNIKSDGSEIDPSKEKQLSYLFVLNSGESIETITKPFLNNAKILDTIIRYAALNGEGNYISVDSVRSIPSDSCVNLLYVVETSGTPSVPVPPIINVIPPLPKELEELEWTNVDEVRFIGYSNDGNPVDWIAFEKEDYIPMNTRILYKFSYSSRGNWSNSVDSIEEVPKAASVLVKAYLQVKTSKFNDEDQEHPEITRMKLIQEGGIEAEYIDESNEYDITFYEITSLNAKLKEFFDYDYSTSSTAFVNSSPSNFINVKWKFKKGVEIPETLVNKALNIKAGANGGRAFIQFLDEKGTILSYKVDDGSKITSTQSLWVAPEIKTHTILIPENASTIRFYSDSPSVTGVNLQDIRFSNVYGEVGEIENVSLKATASRVTLDWSKKGDVEEVLIYRDGTFVGKTKENKFTDPTILSSNTKYVYSFITKDAFGNIRTFEDPSKYSVRTLLNDITFYTPTSSTLQNALLPAFDYNIGTPANVNQNNKVNSFIVNWKFAEGVEEPTSYKGKVIHVRASSNINGLNGIRVVDAEGKALNSHSVSTANTLTYHSYFNATTAVTNYQIVLPEGAAGIQFFSNSTTTSTLSLYDLRFVDLSVEANPITDIQVIPSYENVSIRWTKPASASFVDVYRDGTYVGQSTGSSFTDPNVLQSNTTYKYTFGVRTSQNVTNWIPEVVTKTLERDIIFHSNTSTNMQNLLLKAFDYNQGTYSPISQNNVTNVASIKWKLKEGTVEPTSYKGKVVQVRANNITNNYNFIRVVNSAGNYLSFHMINNTTNTLTATSGVYLTTALTTYQIVLPEGAAGIVVMGTSSTFVTANIYDIRFIDLKIEVDPITDIKLTPSYEYVSISWSKPSNASIVEVYRNGTYVGQSTGTSFTDLGSIQSNTNYTYTFAVRTAENVTTWIPAVTTKTLERDITFYTPTSSAIQNQLLNFFAPTIGAASTINQTDTQSTFIVKWKYAEGYDAPSSMAGKKIQIQGKTASKNANYFHVVNANGSSLNYQVINSNGTLTTVSRTYFTTDTANYTIVLPEGAAGIRFASSNNWYTLATLNRIQFVD